MTDILFGLSLIVMCIIGGAWLLWAWPVRSAGDRARHLSGDAYPEDIAAARRRHPSARASTSDDT